MELYMTKICKRCSLERKKTSFRKLKCRNGSRSDVCRYCYDNNKLKKIVRTADQIESQRKKMLGRKYSLEHRMAISKSQKKLVDEGKNNFFNPHKKIKNPDDFRNRFEYKIWKDKLLEKVGYKCESCGGNNRLCGHHKKCFYEFPELRFDLDNGQILCLSCHQKLHRNEFLRRQLS